MFEKIIIILGFLIFPLFILFLCNRVKFIYKIGPVVFAYVFGVIFGNLGIFDESHRKIIEYIALFTIPLALPLLLFSSDLKKWIKLAPNAAISLILGVISIILAVFIGYIALGDKIPESWKISGMLIGVYTGGTPNLAAIKTALNVDNEAYIMTHTYDLIISSFFLLFVMTVGQSVLSFILPSYKYANDNKVGQDMDFNGKELFWGLHKKKYTKGLIMVFILSLIVAGVSYFLGSKVDEKYQLALIILLITTFGLFFSLFKKVKQTERSFELGMYFILIFSMAVSTLADIRQLSNISPYLFLFIIIAIFGSLAIHIVLSYFFKIDTDTVIITATALTCSPPLVPPVAGALKNKEIVLSGIAIGVIGYAIGNYIGIFFAYLLLRL